MLARMLDADAGVVEQVDTRDLKSLAAQAACGFDARPRQTLISNRAPNGHVDSIVRVTCHHPHTSARPCGAGVVRGPAQGS